MAKLSKTAYLTIHGHFYQPPRENPWIERIERQPDAAPFHDWNDRIMIQCYQPNAMSRIVDSEGKVTEMVNNFRLLNFDVGPTLMSWLERHAPIVYLRILEGDRLSVQERNGHGNAVAQVYNHMILPLGEERDQRTQIRWGIFEFKKRFSRDPAGIWLPETAANPRTLEILIEEGIQFTILAPEQAARVRPLEVTVQGEIKPGTSPDWEDVSNGSIDPTRPYRFFHSKDPGRSLDLFFFDGPLSREMSFGDLLFDSRKFLARLLHSHHSGRSHPELIHTATDGETFGHHKAFGERVITFALQEEAERHGFKRTNYGEYLEKFPPQFEVEIRSGAGTSWSCPHGVGRWKENCGCHTGGEPGWNQKWRTPLREAVSFLEDRIGKLYEKEIQGLLKDPWAARDGYIEVILDRTAETVGRFFEKQAARALSPEEKIRGVKLLEITRYALLTETSCGWFFNDISGIETVQILRYALRALELAAEFGGAELEREFVEKLGQAKSNRPDFVDGRGVWEKLVKPARFSPERIVAHYAFRKLFELDVSKDNFYHHRIEEGETEGETMDGMVLRMGSLKVTHRFIPEVQEFIYAIFHDGASNIQCFVKRSQDRKEFPQWVLGPLTHLRRKQGGAVRESLKRSFNEGPFGLRDLLPEERERILWVLSQRMREDLYETALRFYSENREGMVVFQESESSLPEEFRIITEWMMGQRLFEIVGKLDAKTPYCEILSQGRALLEETRTRGLKIYPQPAIDFLSQRLNGWIEKLFHEPDPLLVQRIEEVLELAKELHIRIHDRIAQDLFFVFAQTVLRDWIEAYRQGKADEAKLKTIQAIIRLGGSLGFNMRQYENQLKQKAEVR